MKIRFQYSRTYMFKASNGRRKRYFFNLVERSGEGLSFNLNAKGNEDVIPATIEMDGEVETTRFLYYGKEFTLRADDFIYKGYSITIDGRLEKKEDALRDAHLHTIDNRQEVKASKTCYCIACQTFFPPSEVESYADGGETAICPYCGCDAVIGDRSGIRMVDEWLDELHRRYFGYDDIE